jgi:hypothetical protein
MSFDSLPDEVLVKILHESLVNDDPIPTSIEAHDIYQAYLVNIDRYSDEECLVTQGFTERRPVISALLLGVCKRWYRLGCPLFYRYNTFAVMHYDLATFAEQIGAHNSVYVREVDLTIHFIHPNLGNLIPLLPTTDIEHVETFNFIYAEHNEKFHRQSFPMWSMMRDTARKLRNVVYNYADSSGGKWTVAKPDRCFPTGADSSFVWSSFWTLKRNSTLSKVWTKTKPPDSTILTHI